MQKGAIKLLRDGVTNLSAKENNYHSHYGHQLMFNLEVKYKATAGSRLA